MAIVKFSNFKDFTAGIVGVSSQALNMAKSLAGYGFNTSTGRVVSYKNNSYGVTLDKRISYRLNGTSFYHSEVAALAKTLAACKYTTIYMA